jgi:predicted amidohydrolase YtcJ
MRSPFRVHAAHIFARLLIASLVSLFSMHLSLAQPADTILLNGKIVLLDQQSSIAQALAIRGERIVAVGSSNDVMQRRGERTRIIDLGGRTVIPGLIDSHIHAIRAGLKFSTEVSWIGATSIEEAMERIRSAAKYAKPDAWIVVAGGWTPNQFVEQRRPTQADLMAAAPDHPVYVQLFYRAVLLTPAGLKALRLEDEAHLAANMKFDRGEDGQPNGWISGDSAAITGLYSRLPRPTLEQSMAGTRRFLHELNRYGITGVIDPGGHNLSPEEYEPLFRVWRAGELSVRITYSVCAPQPGSELTDLQTLTRFLPMGVGDSMLRFNGIGERITWGMYNNDTPTESQKDEFYRVVHWAAERGLTLTAHWNNEKSVHHLLDVFERVDREVSIRELRWSVAHLHDASELSLTRMKALGVGWLMQNGLYFAAPSFLASRGSAINRAPPIKTALRLGLDVGGGTDADRVMSYNPFVSLQWMVDGRTVEGMTTRSASELISREEALRIYTAGSAWFGFEEDRRGTLEPGRLADLAVLDKDYFTVPTEEISRLTAVLTILGGRIVHAGAPFDELRPNWDK